MSGDTAYRILILEASPGARRELDAALREAGFAPEFLVEPCSVLELARMLHPAAVITTVFPPRFQGLALCRQLRVDPQTMDIPVFVTSMLDLEESAMEAGAAGFFPKPLQPDLLIRRMRALRVSAS